MDRTGDRTVQVDRSKADDAADRSRIYGVARKIAPDEQGSVRRRHLPRDNHHLPSLVSKSSCDCDDADIDKTYRMCCNHYLQSLVSKSSCDGDDADVDMTLVGNSPS